MDNDNHDTILNYLESIHKQVMYYKTLGDRTFAQLSDEEIHWTFNPQSNSIAVLVKHLRGNMLSRWTDFLTSDGEKEWRNRDQEFIDDISDKEDMIIRWEEGWKCFLDTLNIIDPSNINNIVYIRNIGHSVTEAINRSLGHYACHIGQIMYIGRMIKGDQWRSLSIPPGKSDEYNEKKFSAPKHRGHYTDEFS